MSVCLSVYGVYLCLIIICPLPMEAVCSELSAHLPMALHTLHEVHNVTPLCREEVKSFVTQSASGKVGI